MYRYNMVAKKCAVTSTERSYYFDDVMLLARCIFAGLFSLFNWLGIVCFLACFSDKRTVSIFMVCFFFIQLGTLTMILYDLAVADLFSEHIPNFNLYLCTFLGGGPASTSSIIFFEHRADDANYLHHCFKVCLFSAFTPIFYSFAVESMHSSFTEILEPLTGI